MESESLIVQSDIRKDSFIEHLFNFDQDTKSQLMNIFQYTVLAIIPVILLNKGVAKIIPTVDEDKASYVLTAELLGQAVLMFFGMFLIHRFVTYFKTYSGVEYAPFHTTNVILLFLVIVASFQTRIGEKTNILIDRFFDLIEGRSTLGESKEESSCKGQPQKGAKAPQMAHQAHAQQAHGGHPHGGHMPSHQPSRADMAHAGTTNISQLQADERGPDFNSMFSGPNNPLQNAQSPGQIQEPFAGEPVAANSVSGSLWNAF
jgi:hypothetical protein